jgi:cytosine/adenosine deaminase-related metal-dependent hydrolase
LDFEFVRGISLANALGPGCRYLGHDGRWAPRPPNAGLFVRDGIIEQVGPTEELPQDAEVELDMTGQLVESLLSTAEPLRRSEWMTAREVLEIATCGRAAVLGRSDIGELAPGMCADFFSLDLNTVAYAGGLDDPVAATVFCAPQKGRYTVDTGGAIVENGQVTTVDMDPVIEAHDRFSRALAGAQLTSAP